MLRGELAQTGQVGLRACGQQERRSKMPLLAEMDAQMRTDLDRLGTPFDGGSLRHERELRYELTAAPELARRNDSAQFQMRLPQVRRRGFDQGGGPVQMPSAMAALSDLQPLQDLGLQGGSEAFRGFDAVCPGGLLQLFERRDAELSVKPHHPVGPQARNGEKIEHPCGHLAAHGFETGMRTGRMHSRNHARDRAAHARNFPQAIFGDDLGERLGQSQEILSRAGKGARTKPVPSVQGDALAEFR